MEWMRGASKRRDKVKVGLQLDLLASDRAHRGKVVVVKVVLVLVRITSGAGHGLGRQTVVGEEGGRRRSNLGVGTATTRSGHTGIDAGHAKAVRAREGRGKAVAVTVLGRGGRLAMRRLLSVSQIC